MESFQISEFNFCICLYFFSESVSFFSRQAQNFSLKFTFGKFPFIPRVHDITSGVRSAMSISTSQASFHFSPEDMLLMAIVSGIGSVFVKLVSTTK